MVGISLELVLLLALCFALCFARVEDRDKGARFGLSDHYIDVIEGDRTERSLQLVSGLAQFRIWNGGPAPEERYPYAVSIRGRAGAHLCGATLIAPKWVMTAAHCVDPENGMLSGLKNPELWVGFYDEQGEEGDFEKFNASKILIHPLYDSSTASHDIALLQLPKESSFPPAVLADSQKELYDGRVLTVMGWGRTEEGTKATVLQHVDLLFVDRRQCSDAWDGHITETMFCAGGGIFDSCDGDSGSSIIADGGSPEKDVVVGVVSWGLQIRCGQPGKPGVYTDVASPDIRSFLLKHVPSLREGAVLPVDAPVIQTPPPRDRVDSATLIASALETEQAKESGGGVVEDLFDLLGSTTPGMDTRDVPGYAIFRAKDLGFTGDYPCKGSLWRGGCQLDGTAEELGAKCSEDPDCVAFVHLPRGFGKRAAPTGFLKSEFSESSLEDNAFTATYALQREDQPAPPVTPAPPAFSTLEPDPSLPADDSLPTDATLVIDAAALPEPADPTPSPARAQPSPAALSAERQDEANAVEEAGGGSGEGRGGPPRVDGFVAMPKVDWPGAYDYPCPRSDWPGGCRIRDTLSAVAAECVGDPRCHGFVFLPREGASPGSDADGVGFLKEGPLDVRLMSHNPASWAFVKAMQSPSVGTTSTAAHSAGTGTRATPGNETGREGPLVGEEVPYMDGYHLLRNRSVPHRLYDFSCDESAEEDRCVVRGTVAKAVARCDAMEECSGVEWIPIKEALLNVKGLESVGVLKTGKVDLSLLKHSGLSSVYVKADRGSEDALAR